MRIYGPFSAFLDGSVSIASAGEVNPDTGQLESLRFHIAHDKGLALRLDALEAKQMADFILKCIANTIRQGVAA